MRFLIRQLRFLISAPRRRLLIFCGFISFGFAIYGMIFFNSLKDARFDGAEEYALNKEAVALIAEPEEIPLPPPPIHIETPEAAKAIYMTSWVGGTSEWRYRLAKIIEETELNSLVIDVKDCTGRISFEVSDPVLKEIGAVEKRIPDMREFINYLHSKNIYTIARIAVFQDPYFAKIRPDLTVKTKSGNIWKDYKGKAWMDPASQEVWDYIISIAKEAESVGFDELNFDYIRFPSDGNMKDIAYDFWDEVTPRADALKEFFIYLSRELKEIGVPISADLFGMTTSNSDDLNIGQILEYAAPYFDYVAPMVYPSHYPTNFQGYHNPALYPYEVVKYAMDMGVQKLKAASTSPLKLRPWLQDFDLGATYTPEMVREQMQAAYDAGLTSWMLWDPNNTYTREALLDD